MVVELLPISRFSLVLFVVNLIDDYLVPDQSWGHMDLVWSKYSGRLVNQRILDILARYDWVNHQMIVFFTVIIWSVIFKFFLRHLLNNKLINWFETKKHHLQMKMAPPNKTKFIDTLFSRFWTAQIFLNKFLWVPFIIVVFYSCFCLVLK